MAQGGAGKRGEMFGKIGTNSPGNEVVIARRGPGSEVLATKRIMGRQQNMADADEHMCLRLLHWISLGVCSVAAQHCCYQPQEFIMGQATDENLPDRQ